MISNPELPTCAYGYLAARGKQQLAFPTAIEGHYELGMLHFDNWI
jgi:hypothetical protein